jgi:predicted RNA-binding protein YlxR (DUF448 family)
MKTIKRMCVGCRNRESTEQLVRIVSVNRRATVDETRSAPGRGAYLHRNQECIQNAVTRKQLAKALRVHGELDCSALTQLK